jgi:hypothetical protein
MLIRKGNKEYTQALCAEDPKNTKAKLTTWLNREDYRYFFIVRIR